MKKFFHLLLLLLALGCMTAVRAQSGCELYISTDFDSECLITELPQPILAVILFSWMAC